MLPNKASRTGSPASSETLHSALCAVDNTGSVGGIEMHHRHDGSGARVVRAALQPHLAVARLQPQHLVQVLACSQHHTQAAPNPKHVQRSDK